MSAHLIAAILRVILSHEDKHIVGDWLDAIFSATRLLFPRNAGVIFVAHTYGLGFTLNPQAT